MTLWKPQYALDDLHELSRQLFPFLESIPVDGWSQRTGKRDKDWTVKATLAHLVSISQLFQQSVRSALSNTPLKTPDLTRREDLRAFNDAEIARLSTHTPAELITQLRHSFDDVDATIQQLTPDDYQKSTLLKIYSRPIRVMDLIDFQLSHAGIIHGSQITRTGDTTNEPIWDGLSEDMCWRQVDRYLRHFTYAYWQDHAGDLAGDINFHITDGKKLGTWHLSVSPDGSFAHHNLSEAEPLFNVYILGIDTLFGIFTMHMPVQQAIANGNLRFDGDYPEPLTLLSYFSASPPRRDLPA